ncbi:MAG: hypothetical protein ILO34_05755 [Kiritimatiellae bacterium]|nr:hypothetical protein [Kiritimatiellia bacterium]
MIVIASGTALLLAAAVVAVAVLRSYRQPMVLPEVQTMPMTSEVHVKAVEHVSMAGVEASGASSSSAVFMICGEGATAYNYDARNDALRLIARRRDLPEEDVAAPRSRLVWFSPFLASVCFSARECPPCSDLRVALDIPVPGPG